MRRKVTIIGIILALIAVGVLSTFLIIRQNNANTMDDDPVKVISIAETPDYKACQLLTPALIGASFNTLVTNVSEGERSGAIAPNDEPADVCSYTLSGLSHESHELIVQIYPYSVASKDKEVKDPLDKDWSLMSEAKTPSYFRVTESNSKKRFIVRVVNAGKNYIIAFSQQKDSSLISDSELYIYMLSLSNGTSFTQPEEELPDGLPPMPDYDN